MTIKEMAEKYSMDYQLVYQSLANSGRLIRGKKDTQYSERDMVSDCVVYILSRLDKLKAKAWDLVGALERINVSLKKDRTE